MSTSASNLAGLFKLYMSPRYANHERRILYVGKATMGSFEEDDACERYFNGRSRFWSFARAVSKIADPNCTDLSNLAWTNIFKQGVTSGNPLREIAEGQRESASTELNKEVCISKPSLIVLVTAGYYEEIVNAAFLIDGGEGAIKRTGVEGEEKWDLWSRSAYRSLPPIVWMYHPQGKRKQYTDAALNLIREATGW